LTESRMVKCNESSGRARISSVVFLFVLLALNLSFSTISLARISSPEPAESFGPPGVDAGGTRICPDVWGYFYDEADEKFGRAYLDELFQRSNEYHNLGGNYKALANFMDGAVDATYGMIGLTPFTPNDGKSEVGTSVQEFIREELRKADNRNRGGYYQRHLPGKFQQGNGNQYNQLFQNGRSITSVMEPVTVDRWDIAMGPQLEQESCKGFHALDAGYETKYICGWDELTNHTKRELEEHTTSKRRSCNVISIGSNDQWAFEELMIKETSCNIHTFDCTIQNPKKKPKTDQVQFHSVCITGDTSLRNTTINGRSFRTYFDLINDVGLSQEQSITYLKMDVEGYEWDVFLNMVQEAREKNLEHLLPQQIQVELHYMTWMYDLSWAMRAVQTGEIMSLFSMLFREAGYVAVFIEKNLYPSLREVLLLKIYC